MMSIEEVCRRHSHLLLSDPLLRLLFYATLRATPCAIHAASAAAIAVYACRHAALRVAACLLLQFAARSIHYACCAACYALPEIRARVYARTS